jgi:NAD+ kinase
MDFFFIASPAPQAQKAFKRLIKRYGQARSVTSAATLVSIGGDGTTLGALRLGLEHNKPVFGLNYGKLGALQNPISDENLFCRLAKAEKYEIRALCSSAESLDGSITKAFAVNEIQVTHRNPWQGISLCIKLDDEDYIKELSGDGLIIATAIGSTAYSKHAGGSVVDLKRDVIILTPKIPYYPEAKPDPCVFDPCVVDIEVLEAAYRPADAYADIETAGLGIKKIKIYIDPEKKYQLLFDLGYSRRRRAMMARLPEPLIP